MEEKNEIVEETEDINEEIEEVEPENVDTKEDEELKENKKDAEDFLDEKPRKGIFKMIFNVIFWLVVVILLATWGLDYLNVRNNKKPSFCISKQTHKYDDGTVKECTGLGYKIYEYNRSSMAKSVEFVPFFIGIKESSK